MVLVIYLFGRFLYVRIRRPLGVTEQFVTNDKGDRVRTSYAYVYRGITGWSLLDKYLNPMFGMALGEDLSDEEFKKLVDQKAKTLYREKKEELNGKYNRDLNAAVARQIQAIEKQRNLKTININKSLGKKKGGNDVVGSEVGLGKLNTVKLNTPRSKPAPKTSVQAKGKQKVSPRVSPRSSDNEEYYTRSEIEAIMASDHGFSDFTHSEDEAGWSDYEEAISAHREGLREFMGGASSDDDDSGLESCKIEKAKGKDAPRIVDTNDEYTLYPLAEMADGTFVIKNRSVVKDVQTVQFSANMKVKQRPIDGSPFVDFGTTKDVVKLWWKADEGFVEAGTGYFCENKIVTIDHNAHEFAIYGTRMIDPTEPVKLKLAIEANAMGFYDVPQAWRSDPTTKRPPIKFGKFEDCPASGECLIVGFPQTNPFNNPGGLVGSVGKFQRQGDIAKANYSSDHGMSGSAIYLIKNGIVTNQIIGTHEGAAGGSNEFRVVSRGVIDAVRNPVATKKNTDSDATALLIKSLLAKVADVAPQDDDFNVLLERANSLLTTPFVPEGKKGLDRVKGNLNKYKGTSASSYARGPVRLRRKFWSTKYNQYVDYGDVDHGWSRYEDYLYSVADNPDNVDWHGELRDWMERTYGTPDYSHEYPEMDNDEFWIDADDDTFTIHAELRDRWEADNHAWDNRARVRGNSHESSRPTSFTFKRESAQQLKTVAFSEPEVSAPPVPPPASPAPSVPKPTTVVTKSDARAAASVVAEVFQSPGKAPPKDKKRTRKNKATIPPNIWMTLSADQQKFWVGLTPAQKQMYHAEFLKKAKDHYRALEDSYKKDGISSMEKLFQAQDSASKDAEKESA